MPEDASLEDFADRDAGASTSDATERADESDGSDRPEAGSDGADGDETSGSETVDPATVEPATSTYGWSSGGAACEVCGAVVDRRWRDEAGLVCGECKDW